MKNTTFVPSLCVISDTTTLALRIAGWSKMYRTMRMSTLRPRFPKGVSRQFSVIFEVNSYTYGWAALPRIFPLVPMLNLDSINLLPISLMFATHVIQRI